MRRPYSFASLASCVALLLFFLALPAASAEESSPSAAPTDFGSDVVSGGAEWVWPVPFPHTLVRPYRAPADAYAAGHRGIDIAVATDSPNVVAPAAGVVAFAGQVVDRSLVTIDHGNGLVSTLEPLMPTVTIGDSVDRGSVVGTLAVGGHTEPGALHLGVREHGDYINPLVLLGDVPRAVLLPCC